MPNLQPVIDQTKINQYLKEIYFSNNTNHFDIECNQTPPNGKTELCKYLANKLDYLHENNLFLPPDQWKTLRTRHDIAYLARGYFGLVFWTKIIDGPNISYIAIKIMEIYERSSFMNEVYHQMRASGIGISPKIYDYYICQCNKTYGLIIMEFLDGYMPDYELYPIIAKKANKLNWNDAISRTIFKNELKLLQTSINTTINKLIDEAQIVIPDFQIMIHPKTFQIKVIDFGMAEPVGNKDPSVLKHDIKKTYDYLFKTEQGHYYYHPIWS